MLSLSLPLADSFTHEKNVEVCRTISKRKDTYGIALLVLFSNTLRNLQTLSNSNPAMLEKEKRQTPRSFCGSTLALEVWD